MNQEDNKVYSITNKCRFYLWLHEWAETLADSIYDGSFEEVFDIAWPEVMEIFGLDDYGDNFELEFTRKFIIDNDMMFALGSSWDRYKRNLS